MHKKYEYGTAFLWNRDGFAAASGPYNNSFRQDAKELGAEWKLGRSREEAGAWVVPLERADELRELLKSCYGEFVDELAGEVLEADEAEEEVAEQVETKRMLVRAKDTFDSRKRGTERLYVAGVEVARIWRGKAGKNEFHDPAKVYLADGVELVSGGFEMDDRGAMSPEDGTVLSVELPADAESTVEFEVLGEDNESEERFSEEVERKAERREYEDKLAYDRAAKLVAADTFDMNDWERFYCAEPKGPMRAGWVYGYTQKRVEDADCPQALKEARAALERRAAKGAPEVLAAWNVSAHEKLSIRRAISS
jgi:hypothetical protein